MLKELAIFTFGGVVGGSIAFFVTRNVITKRERAIAEEKIASMKEYVDELRARDEAGALAENLKYFSDDTFDADPNNVSKNYDGGSTKRSKKDQNKADEPVKPGTYEYTKYNAYYKGSSSADNDGAIKLDKVAYEHPEDDTDVDEEDVDEFNRRNAAAGAYELMQETKLPPKFVSEEEFNDHEYDHHSKSTLFYYAKDGIIVDESEQEMVHPENMLGKVITNADFEESDVIFCRNFRNSCDFRIEKVDESW